MAKKYKETIIKSNGIFLPLIHRGRNWDYKQIKEVFEEDDTRSRCD